MVMIYPTEVINLYMVNACLQCESMVAVERRLKEMGIPYVQRCVEEGGINVDQIFFHDPDGNVIEVCDCEKLPVIPLADAGAAGLPNLLLPVEMNVHG